MSVVLVLGTRGGLGHMVERILLRCAALTTIGTSRGDVSGTFYFDVKNGLRGLQQIVQEHGPFDYLINCIGILRSAIDESDVESVHRSEAVNAIFPHTLADLADKIGAKVIHVSTDAVFSNGAGMCSEDDPISCTDIYGKSKVRGEIIAPSVLNFRCSIIGPHPYKKEGLVEWFRAQKPGTEVLGYKDHLWNGVTTLQLAQLFRLIILEQRFELIRNEGPIHHFCPNRVVSKEELLRILKSEFDQPVEIRPVLAPGGSINRVLKTRYVEIKKLCGHDLPMQKAIRELLSEMRDVA